MMQNVFFWCQMELSRYLRQHARTIAGKSQLFINSYAKALEVRLFGIVCAFFYLDENVLVNYMQEKNCTSGLNCFMFSLSIVHKIVLKLCFYAIIFPFGTDMRINLHISWFRNWQLVSVEMNHLVFYNVRSPFLQESSNYEFRVNKTTN